MAKFAQPQINAVDESEQAYWSQKRSTYKHAPGSGARDVRKGDRWLAWHFTLEGQAIINRIIKHQV